MKKNVSLWICALILICGQGIAQQFALEPYKYHVFDADSLKGFDDASARASAISEGFVGDEFPVRMYDLKRKFINDKYNLWKPHVHEPSVAERGSVVPACTNEDFEGSDAGQITVSNQINGWTVTRGTNQGANNNSCNLNGCCPSQPSEAYLFSVPNGHIDSKIGPCYPIYSVFGDGPANTAAAAANPHIELPMKGNNFIRINSDNNNYSIEKLSKTFVVTPSNALFQFAFISVFSPGHGCCDAGAFKISLPGIPCPTFSASAPSAQCTNTTSGIQFLSIPSGGSTVTPCSAYSPTQSGVQYVFNKWQLSSMDLTAYINQTITIDIVASDCTAGGHFGYVYFDAQCGPMSILGNGTPFPAGDTNVIVPTCGPSGATICATPGLGPYSWAGPNIPPGYSTPSFTNQCFTTSISATYTLYMNPPGGCAAFTRIVQTTVTPAPTLVGNVQQAQCGDTIAVVTVTPGGSAGNPSHLTWYPPPYNINSSTTSAQYIIPPVNSPTMVVTVTAADQIGCPVTLTLGVNPPAPVPEFTVTNNTGTYTLTCLTPSISLDVTTTYTYGSKEYFWSNNNFTSNAQGIVVTTPGSYTVTLSDPVSKCARTRTLSIGESKQLPVGTISPTFQNITCATAGSAVNVSATTPTVNIQHSFLSPLGGSFVSTNQNSSYLPGPPGTYTYQLTNLENGCKTTRQFTIASSDGFPTFSLTSAQNFTLGCNSRSVAEINIDGAQASPTDPGGAVSYSLLTPGASSVLAPGVLSTQSKYTTVIPGNYTVVTKNNANGCVTRIPISVLSNTTPPSIDSVITPVTILSCFTPTTVIKGISYSPNVNYRWRLPQSQVQSGDELPVSVDFTKPTQTLIATYTLVVEDNSSTCTSSVPVVMAQNLFPPLARISGTSVILTCVTPSVVLSNNSTWGAGNPFPKPLPVVSSLWEGPSPQLPRENSTTYDAFYQGSYTMTATDLNNGCRSTTVVTVEEDRVYPLVEAPLEKPMLGCGALSTPIVPQISTSTVGLVYNWTSSGTQTVSGATSRTLTAFSTGVYRVVVTDTENGCATEATMEVFSDTLVADIEAEKVSGYAPFTVTLHNKSHTSQDSVDIESLWVFGNSLTASLSSVTSTNVTYHQPGQYTVTLFARKGECLDTAKVVIAVDIPSQMVIPNVFTPNGDGVNDLFFLQRSSNLSQITALIYDRWGNKVYEVSSEKGQIEWDGTTMTGKEAPTGTYFYIITAKGFDGKEYDEKGTLSLIR